ncbi:MAG: DUF4392 domain-containing protein, partial [Nitrososphaeria archaeon]|nr:DUF4392 domain-containing protein [Nitrososphaeria archaeon]
MSENLVENIGKTIDRLITVDVGGRGVIQKLYPPALERQGGAPLTLQAAKRLREVVGEGDTVLIATGMLIYPYWELGETDGPLGGAALARALQIGLDAKPVLVTDKVLTDMVT